MTVTVKKSDSMIQREVLDELRWDPRVDESEVGVQVKGGTVSLTGRIGSYAKKLAAAEAAHRVAGVLDVANDLEVVVPGMDGRSDEEIAKTVRRTLEWDVYVPHQKITTTVADGWVTLEGEVEWVFQRDDAARVIERLGGVRGVINHITVRSRPVDAAAVRRSIEQALERQAEREARRLRIDVEGGLVKLTGKVHSWSERTAVESAARFAPGVQRVENLIRGDPSA
jgi:osmotically-inducible protein OsmY